MTVGEALRNARSRLEASDMATAGLDASLLLAKALNCTREQLYARLADSMAQESEAALQSLLDRRLAGWNIAYLLGIKEFMGLELLVDPRVLVPRPDTETLVEAGLRWLSARPEAQRILDVCTGSGAVALAIKHHFPGREVAASDLSAQALEVARENSRRLGLPLVFWEGNLMDAVPGEWDLILSNPPYLTPVETRGRMEAGWKEPAMALDGGGADGLDLPRRLVRQAAMRLRMGGALMMEAGPPQMTELARAFGEAGLSALERLRDLEGRERVLSGTRVDFLGAEFDNEGK